ncbi:hypothetical protein AB0B66_09840 [Catellatospora sp. NPDC049111]|uniref:hypothetical protein n=1 Tax=Catellatospora sp. NPDC049111 TaxID=3155271 RepID=UPI0033D54B38
MTEKAADAVWAPQECTLPTAQQPLRMAELDALFTTAIRSAENLGDRHLRLTLAGGPDLETMVRDLAARESDCCSFFTFTTTATAPGEVTLDVEVPPAHTDVLSALAERADTMRRPR